MDQPDYQPNFLPYVLLSAAVVVFLVAMDQCGDDCQKRGGKLVRGLSDFDYECVEPVRDHPREP